MLSCEAKDLAMKQMGERADPIKANLREFRGKKKEKKKKKKKKKTKRNLGINITCLKPIKLCPNGGKISMFVKRTCTARFILYTKFPKSMLSPNMRIIGN